MGTFFPSPFLSKHTFLNFISTSKGLLFASLWFLFSRLLFPNIYQVFLKKYYVILDWIIKWKEMESWWQLSFVKQSAMLSRFMIFLESTDLLSQIQFESHYFWGEVIIFGTTYFFLFETEVPELGHSMVALSVLAYWSVYLDKWTLCSVGPLYINNVICCTEEADIYPLQAFVKIIHVGCIVMHNFPLMTHGMQFYLTSTAET